MIEAPWFKFSYRKTMVYYTKVLCDAEQKGPQELMKARRLFAEKDLFFLLTFILNRQDLFHPWLFSRCREVQLSPNGHLDLWAREHGKDLADDTPILTANRGWTTHGKLEIGDKVYSPNGKPVSVIALSERYFTSKCFELELNDGEKITAGAGHLWRLRKKRKIRVGEWRKEERKVVFEDEVVTTEEIYDRLRKNPKCRVDLGAAKPLIFQKKNLPIDSKYMNSRYVKSVSPVKTVPTRCIQVEGGLYLAGKTLVPTHNSSIITFGLTIFDIISDPEITIGIFSHTKAIARDFVRQIKTELENNDDLPRLWPKIFFQDPSRESKRWSIDGGICVKRKTNPKEATVEGHGLVDGMPTGKHFKGRVYDDVVTIESVSTPDQILKTTTARQLSDNLGAIGGWERYIGTRYHLFDDYRVMIDGGVAIPRIHPATKNGKENGEPVLMSSDVLKKKRRNQGPFTYAAQMLLDPTADKAMGFDRKWLAYGDTDESAAKRTLWRFIIVDPAGGKQRKNNDYTTFWVIGHGADGKYRVLDIVRDRLRLTQRCDTLMELHRKWKPHLVAYEEYGMQADIEHIKYVQEQDLYEFDIVELGGRMSKENRILRLVPLFENGFDELENTPKSRIILPTSCIKRDYQGHSHDLVKDFVEQEYTAFPVLAHDDMLDGLGRITCLEEMNLIETPKAQPAKLRGHSINEGLHNAGKKGNDSWLTA